MAEINKDALDEACIAVAGEGYIFAGTASTKAAISAYLASVEAKGMVVVPSEPTAHMNKVGAYQVSFLTRVGAAAVYRAMVHAGRDSDATESVSHD